MVPRNRRRAGHVGRPRAPQGLRLVVEALAELPDAELLVAGGPRQNELDADPERAGCMPGSPGSASRIGCACSARCPHGHAGAAALGRRRRLRPLVRAVRARPAGGDGLRRARGRHGRRRDAGQRRSTASPGCSSRRTTPHALAAALPGCWPPPTSARRPVGQRAPGWEPLHLDRGRPAIADRYAEVVTGGAAPGPGRPIMNPVAAVLFDRDGTLIHDVPYLDDPAGVRPVDGARALLDRLRARGLAVGVVSNQSGVARGLDHAERWTGSTPGSPSCSGPSTPGRSARTARTTAAAAASQHPGWSWPRPPRWAWSRRSAWSSGDIGADVGAALAAGARAVLVPDRRHPAGGGRGHARRRVAADARQPTRGAVDQSAVAAGEPVRSRRERARAAAGCWSPGWTAWATCCWPGRAVRAVAGRPRT